MKAIIMAGGEGKRLRPLSVNKPKPMVELLDRPVLMHIIELLTRNGVTEACLTLKYLPQVITDYFGSGSAYGIRLDSRIETEALGTAGGVLNCSDFITANGVGVAEDFLVISGDCVCDFDLKALMAFHCEKQADVTMALYSHDEPCEYGLVVTDDDGRITRFIEKPAWDHVLTDRINTGIYVISPRVLREIPKGEPYDFGRDLFPKMLSEDRRMYGFKAEGYWCDIGSTGAYLKCCLDALRGSVKINMGTPETGNGIWCQTDMPEGVTVIPPVYIGKNVVIDRGAVIGPLAVIGASSVIGSGAAVTRSVVSGTMIGDNASLDGSVVCKGTSVGRGSTLADGSVIGENSVIGDGCVVTAGAKVWPGQKIPSGSVVTGIVSHKQLSGGLTFCRPGVISGEPGVTMTVDACLRLGEVAGEYGRVGIGWSGGETARVLAEAFGCGVCAAGGDLIRYDGSFSSCASYAGLLFDLPLTVFIEEMKSTSAVTFYGKNGGGIARELERKLEMAVTEPHQMALGRTGRTTTMTGVCDAYVSAAARQAFSTLGNTGTLPVTITGTGAENRALKSVLLLMNCTVSDKRAGQPSLEVRSGGTDLTATDEEGYRLSDDQIKALVAFIEFSCGTTELAVPYDAPTVIDQLAEKFGATVLRVDRDGQRAEELYLRQLVMRDAVFAGARLCAWLKSRGESLSALRQRVPRFSTMTREVTVKSSRGAAMRLMSSSCAGMSADITSGLRLETDRGCVYISPLREKSALRIHAESFSEETAEELCVEFERRAHEIDQK